MKTFILFTLLCTIGFSAPPQTITFQYEDQRACDVLREVALLFEIKAEVPDDLCSYKVSGTLRDVDWKEIFAFTLAQTDFTFIEKNGVAYVVRKKKTEPNQSLQRTSTAVTNRAAHASRQLLRSLT